MQKGRTGLQNFIIINKAAAFATARFMRDMQL